MTMTSTSNINRNNLALRIYKVNPYLKTFCREVGVSYTAVWDYLHYRTQIPRSDSINKILIYLDKIGK